MKKQNMSKPFKPLKFKARTENQADFVRSVNDNDVTFSYGPAGTGKTFLAVAMAWKYFKAGDVNRIIITRPTVETSSGTGAKKYGALPGDLRAKIAPFLRPVYEEFQYFLPKSELDELVEAEIIEIAPLEFMRGRNFHRCFCVLDEAQNCTETEIDMFLTRLGKHTKAVLNGDVTQTDLPQYLSGAFEDCLEAFTEDEIGVGVTEFLVSDIQRNPLTAQMMSVLRTHRKNKGESDGSSKPH